jgi:hypothetical protein
MIKHTSSVKAGILAVSAALVLGLSFGTAAQAPTDPNSNQSTTYHGNTYGKFRSTTHEQRLAAAARRAELMKRVKAQHEASGTMANDTAAATGKKTPRTHKISTTN